MKEIQSTFEQLTISQIPRNENTHADALATLGSTIEGEKIQSIPIVYLQWPVIWKNEIKEITTITPSDAWLTPIVKYLENGILPEDKTEARRIQRLAAKFTLHNGELLRRSLSGPYLKCLIPEEAQYVLAELHEDECENHSEGRSLACRAHTT